MTLFKECLVALEEKAEVLSELETLEIFEKMTKDFPINSWGRIDWENVQYANKISTADEIMQYIKGKGEEVYVLWDEASLPSIKTEINSVLHVINDITAVSFDTWLYSPSGNYVIEFYHENEITIGYRSETH